ncbi:hypothetical protein NDU88_001698 [Pleurodeles waltl]|uniref:Uncharacterized protein n=1 Tax=Pleurodeles waltl TaxID=8319 RepID=A0AAV7TKW2_PLEWA|nr:hypothetical protein NDU88_001698 [Pleurodeles waltl]
MKGKQRCDAGSRHAEEQGVPTSSLQTHWTGSSRDEEGLAECTDSLRRLTEQGEQREDCFLKKKSLAAECTPTFYDNDT